MSTQPELLSASNPPDPETADYFPRIPLLKQTSVLVEREGGLVECYVPKDLIDHEEVPVKQEWAASLAAQMKHRAENGGGTGQKTPIQLGWIPGEAKFRIIDGFHRDAALVINGESEIYATVELTDWNKLYDERIFTAKDHVNVRFSRVVRWIQEVWQHSGLDDSLSVEQAILLYRYEGSGGRLGLEPSVVKAAKEWVANKESQWDLPAMTIHGYLQTAESVDPLLVAAVREKTSSNSLKAPTQQIIKIFSENLPTDFSLQNLVWETAQPHNLKGPQIKAVCELVKGRSLQEARDILADTDVATIAPAYGKTTGKQLRRAADPRHKGAAALDAATAEIERVNLRVRQSIERGEKVDALMAANLNETLQRARQLREALGQLAVNIAELKEKSAAEQAADREKANSSEPAEEAFSSHSPASVRRAFERHDRETTENKDFVPKDRLRHSNISMELPTYGRFTNDDWTALDPHHRFALALDHPLIASGAAKGNDLYMKLLRIGQVVPAAELPTSFNELKRIVSEMNDYLIKYSPVGPIIKMDQGLGRPVITEVGSKHLKEAVRNALISVDVSRGR